MNPSTALRPPAPLPPEHVIRQDLQELMEREQNLRLYEERLRRMQAEIERRGESAGPARAPEADPALQAAWAKFHRASQLLSAEQDSLVNERLRLREEDTRLRRLAADLSRREAALANRERAESPLETLRQATAVPFQRAVARAFLPGQST